MKKKHWLIAGIMVFLLLVIPIPTGIFKDGGTRTYTALTYKIVQWHHLYANGTYDAAKVYPFPMNFLSLDALLAREQEKLPALQEDSAPTFTPIDTHGRGTQYIRTHGGSEQITYPKAVVIHSLQELQAYYEANKETFHLERREDPASDSTVGFLDACDRYDDTYFETRVLILVLLEEGSGSIRHQVTSVVMDQTGTLNIQIAKKVPEVGTCDMAQWHLFVEPAEGVTVADENNVRIVLSRKEDTLSVQDLMANITPHAVTTLSDLTAQNTHAADFAFRLLQASMAEKENTLVSPLSVLCALAMTANGAEEDTLTQMESVLGMDRDSLNLYLHSYMTQLPQADTCRLNLANAIWFTDNDAFSVQQEFLQTNGDFYGADIYKVPFNTNTQTLQDINNWVSGKTDGMIPSLLQQCPEDTVMCLVNALAFQGDWAVPYTQHQVKDGTFTQEGGTAQAATFLHGSESFYLQDDQAVGMVKYYQNQQYAFVALLPNEGVRVTDYAASLSGQKLESLLSDPRSATVRTAIPKFEASYDTDLARVLSAMGMPLAFDPNLADFGALGSFQNRNIYIDQVLHKTFLRVDEKGTQAGAATAVIMRPNSVAPPEVKEICLDRPFVYMLIDCKNHVPLFLGTLMSV